ncbi:MAG: 4Fe-4S dicluster domain-containing protein [Planctomycetota bacterium]
MVSPENRFHTLTRCCVLGIAILLALPVFPWPSAPMIVPAASPHITVAAAVATRAVGMTALIGLPVLVIALFRRRWFCRYACPVGLILETAGRLRKSSNPGWKVLPPIGQWMLLITLGGAILGYPLLIWLDPLSIFNGFFGVFRRPVTASAALAAMGLPILLILSLLWPGAWHGRICPLGAMQDLLSLPKRLFRKQREAGEQDVVDGMRLARRCILAAAAGAVWAGATLKFRRGGKVIRPPGAIDERRFTGLCARCGSCARACPEKIIHPDLGASGVAGFLTPAICFDESYCKEDCARCTEACPTGALMPMKIEAKWETQIGIAKVDMSVCLLSEERECSFCQTACPYAAIDVVFNDETYASTIQVHPRKCTGCGACEVACPTSPRAIVVAPVGS